MARRHQTLIPLSREHHDGLLLAWRLTKGDLKDREAKLRIKHAVTFFEYRLRAHFDAEERALFPAVREALADGAALLDELMGEHREFAAKAEALKAGDESQLAPFCDLLEQHIRKEERRLFPLIEARIPAEQLAALEPQIKELLGIG